MKSASLTDAKNNLSAYVDQVRAGNSILITDRNTPVAKLVPVSLGDETDAQRLDRLERAGRIRRGRGKLPKSFWTKPLPKLRGGATLVDAVLDERREGR